MFNALNKKSLNLFSTLNKKASKLFSRLNKMPNLFLCWDRYECEKAFLGKSLSNRKLQTKVSSVDGNKVTLEETIFFAFSGGQESDHGSIGGYEVLKAGKVGKKIFYTLPDDHMLKMGDTVDVVIDEETRLNLMKLHFAAELVLIIVTENYGYPGKTGAHISPDKVRVDFAWEGSIDPILPEVSARLNQIIEGNLPITSVFENESEERRYWEIEGLAKVPCGGTHPKKTGELGKMRLKRKNIGKGQERIEITFD